MKMKADLKETRDREKQMWNVVNEKRDVNKRKCSHQISLFYCRN